jgi:hypothetical protein
VSITGTVTEIPTLCPVGVPCKPITNIALTLTNEDTHTKSSYAFSSGEQGIAGVVCQ